MKKYKANAVVDANDEQIFININQYTYLSAPKRSYLNKILRLKPGDKVQITVVKK